MLGDDDISPQPHLPILPNASQSEGGHRLLPPTKIELGSVPASSNANFPGNLGAEIIPQSADPISRDDPHQIVAFKFEENKSASAQKQPNYVNYPLPITLYKME